MSAILWTKWYFPDWTNDPGLRASSLQARGLWMDMLCLAARHDPPGYVAINGNSPSSETLARMVGASVQDVETLVDELERNGVFSRNRNGMIYSRRMVRETKMAKTAKENGKKGGSPILCKIRGISDSVNPPLNHTLNTHIFQEASKPEYTPPLSNESVGVSTHAGKPNSRKAKQTSVRCTLASRGQDRALSESQDESDAFDASGLPSGDYDQIRLKFEDHHNAKGSLMLDWVAAWRTWLRNEVEFRQRKQEGQFTRPFDRQAYQVRH